MRCVDTNPVARPCPGGSFRGVLKSQAGRRGGRYKCGGGREQQAADVACTIVDAIAIAGDVCNVHNLKN